MNPRPFTILVVSPDRQSLRRLSKFLDVFGYDVRQAIDAERAIVAAESAQPDFLIVDGSSGQPADLQLCQAVRRAWPKGYTYSLLLAERPAVGDITAALEAGFDDFLSAPIVFGELLARLRAGARYIEYERRLADQTGTDSVTGLADRAALAAELVRRGSVITGDLGWLAILDIDYFQRAVDRFGRTVADELLRQVAEQIRGRLGGDKFAAALGEDRFAVLMPPDSPDAAVRWCEEVLQVLAGGTFTGANQAVRFTASCGLSEVRAGDSLEAVYARGQRALQLAKASGRDCVITRNEVDRDADAWATFAADGKLFHTTLARDVMHPCPLLLSADETVEQAHALLSQTGLDQVPVIDAEHNLVGLVSLEQLVAVKTRHPKPRGSGGNSSSSVRLVRHVMTGEVTRFDERTQLGELMEYFTHETATLAVIVADRRPRGVVHCQALAALNEKLTADHFANAKPRTGTSADLLVPELALAE